MGTPVTGAMVGQKYNPTVTESNPSTPSIPPIGPLFYTTSNPSVVGVDQTTGVATMMAPGTASVTVVDQGNNLTDSVAFTVAAQTATALDLEYTLAA